MEDVKTGKWVPTGRRTYSKRPLTVPVDETKDLVLGPVIETGREWGRDEVQVSLWSVVLGPETKNGRVSESGKRGRGVGDGIKSGGHKYVGGLTGGGVVLREVIG